MELRATVERCWRELPGVHKVSVNSSTGRAKLICRWHRIVS